MNQILNKKTRGQKHDVIEELHNHNILVETREIFIHGEPDADFADGGTDFRMATKFVKNMRILESISNDPIIIHQHNLGGWWDCGMMMYDTIKLSQCYIIFVIHGSACSMGSIVPQAADVRLMMPNAQYMIHTGYTDISGQTYKQAQSWAKLEKRQVDVMIDIYTNVMTYSKYAQDREMTDKKVKQFIMNRLNQTEDWFFLASDAVYYGFAEGILGDKGFETLDVVKDKIVNG